MENLFNLPAISKTGMDKISISPLDYWYAFENPNRAPYVKSDDVIFNEALRCAVFSPNEFSAIYVRQPIINKKTNLGKSEYNSLMELTQKNNQILLNYDAFENIKKMQNALLSHPTLKKLNIGKVGEPSRFVDKESGAVVKFKPHFINPSGIILDLSSTKDASSNTFIKDCAQMNLHKRAALQLDALDLSVFVFIRVETSEPYKIGFHYLDDRAISFGRTQYRENCKVYAECLKTGKWNGLSEKIQPVSLPEWVYNKI